MALVYEWLPWNRQEEPEQRENLLQSFAKAAKILPGLSRPQTWLLSSCLRKRTTFLLWAGGAGGGVLHFTFLV